MILIGTSHMDILGSERLEYLLWSLNPKSVSVEYPADVSVSEAQENITSERESMRQAIEKSLLPDNFQKLFYDVAAARAYETMVAIDYHLSTESDIYFVDHPGVFGESDWDKLIDEFSSLFKQKTKPYSALREEYCKDVDRSYYEPEVIRQWYENMKPQVRDLIIEETAYLDFPEERENMLTEGILNNKPAAHIGGIGHVFEEFKEFMLVEPLYERLGSMVDLKIRLCDAFEY